MKNAASQTDNSIIGSMEGQYCIFLSQAKFSEQIIGSDSLFTEALRVFLL